VGGSHDGAEVRGSVRADHELLLLDASGAAMRFGRETIPAFLSIDVEPDAFQISPDQTDHWPGYTATYAFIASLRAELAKASGAKPIFGWYYRMDPQIEQVCGRADFSMTAYPDRVAALRLEGDYFGVHTHPLRWCAERRLWVHDFGDPQWLRHCTQFGLDAFAACNGSPAKFFRAGAGFLSNDIVDVLDQNGVTIEAGLEPVAGWGLRCHRRQRRRQVAYGRRVHELRDGAEDALSPQPCGFSQAGYGRWTTYRDDPGLHGSRRASFARTLLWHQAPVPTRAPMRAPERGGARAVSDRG
jgi:hypothetical protein